MLRSYLLTLYRSVSRHQLFAALNVFGLAVGMAVFLVLSIAVRFDRSFDTWIPSAERTYRVTGIYKPQGRAPQPVSMIPGPALPQLRAEYGQIESGVRLRPVTYPVRHGERGDYEDMVFADSSFFDVFDLPLAAGRREDALADNNSIVVSQAMARKYFGQSDPIGGRLTVTVDGTPRDYRVVGVLKDLPENTHLKVDFLARLDKAVMPEAAEYLDDWNATNYITYVRLPGPDAAAQIRAGFPAFLKRHGGGLDKWLDLQLDAIPQVHYVTGAMGDFKPAVDRGYVAMLQVIGVLTLLLAVINYVNLATARSVMRAREVALRKVFGATRGALIAQFLVEAVAMAVVAGLIAVALVELALPFVNTALGENLGLTYFGEGGVLLYFLPIVLAVGLVAGAYPALVISRFEPAGVLAASRAPGGGRKAGLVREALVVVQFAVSIALLIGTAVVLAQADFVRNTDLGFNRDKLLLVKQLNSPDLQPRRNTLQDAFRRVPGVQAVTISGRYPGRGETGRSDGYHRPGMVAEYATIAREGIGDGYLETLRPRILAGRWFSAANRVDDRAGLTPEALTARGLNVLINETAAKALEFRRPQDAVGQVIRYRKGPEFRVVGVVQDLRFGSPREKVPPIVYMRDTSADGMLGGDETIVVRYRGDPNLVTAKIEDAWRQVVPATPFEGQTGEASLNTFYEPEEQRGRLVTLGAIVAAIIGCVGLYGLAAFTSERRTREIGIRKVLGASTGDVFRLLVSQFLRPVALANLIAWPVAFLLMREWLNSFDQRIGLSPLYFVGATTLALLVALLTVTAHALKAARSDPGKALHYE